MVIHRQKSFWTAFSFVVHIAQMYYIKFEMINSRPQVRKENRPNFLGRFGVRYSIPTGEQLGEIVLHIDFGFMNLAPESVYFLVEIR